MGLLFAYCGSRLLVRQLSSSATNVFLDLSLDWRILGFTAAIAVGTAILFGMAPALRGMRAQPNDALKAQGRGIAGESRFSFASALVALQVALSLVLLIGAGSSSERSPPHEPQSWLRQRAGPGRKRQHSGCSSRWHAPRAVQTFSGRYRAWRLQRRFVNRHPGERQFMEQPG
jgi:hypothetical protein